MGPKTLPLLKVDVEPARNQLGTPGGEEWGPNF